MPDSLIIFRTDRIRCAPSQYRYERTGPNYGDRDTILFADHVQQQGEKEVLTLDKSVREAIETSTGFLRGRISTTRTGVFDYAMPDGSVRREARFEDSIFSDTHQTSLQMLVCCDGHPVDEDGRPRLVHTSNVRELQVGQLGSKIARNTDGAYPRLDNDILVTERKVIDRMISRQWFDNSLGYTAKLEFTPGEYQGPNGPESYDVVQTQHIANHDAIGIEAGRAGPSASLHRDEETGLYVPLVFHGDVVRKVGNKYRVISERTGRNLGEFDSREEAEAFLARIEREGARTDNRSHHPAPNPQPTNQPEEKNEMSDKVLRTITVDGVGVQVPEHAASVMTDFAQTKAKEARKAKERADEAEKRADAAEAEVKKLKADAAGAKKAADEVLAKAKDTPKVDAYEMLLVIDGAYRLGAELPREKWTDALKLTPAEAALAVIDKVDKGRAKKLEGKSDERVMAVFEDMVDNAGSGGGQRRAGVRDPSRGLWNGNGGGNGNGRRNDSHNEADFFGGQGEPERAPDPRNATNIDEFTDALDQQVGHMAGELN